MDKILIGSTGSHKCLGFHSQIGAIIGQIPLPRTKALNILFIRLSVMITNLRNFTEYDLNLSKNVINSSFGQNLPS